MTNSSSPPQICQAPKRVLIVGCGDIGQRLASQLEPSRFAITGIRRHCPPDLPFLRYRSCDVNQPEALQRILAEFFDVIVITMTPSERSDAGYDQAYVQTCRRLVEALTVLNQQPERIIFVSSTGVYGQCDGSVVDEDSPTEPSSFSGKRLLEAEAIIRVSGFPYCILRVSGIYGPGRTRLIEQVKQRRASASRDYTNRIHADDCAGFIAHLITQDKPPAPLYIVTDSAPTPMIDVVSWIAGRLEITDFLSADASLERGNKQLCNKRMLASGYKLRYENFRDGYGDMIRRDG